VCAGYLWAYQVMIIERHVVQRTYIASTTIYALQVFGERIVYRNEAKAFVVPASFHKLLPVARRPDSAHVAPAPVAMAGVFHGP
jgi:hypothetical protein